MSKARALVAAYVMCKLYINTIRLDFNVYLQHKNVTPCVDNYKGEVQ